MILSPTESSEKPRLRIPTGVRMAICAFANDLPRYNSPGVVFIGVNDDESCTKHPINDELLLSISHMRDDGKILPFPSIEVSKQMIDGCEMAVVIVQPSLNPPVRFDGRTWIRVGPRRAMASPEEERLLSERRRNANLPFDLHPIVHATLEDLDTLIFDREYLPFAVAPDVIAQNQRTLVDRLRALRFLTADGIPTLLGILVLGTDPRNFIPGAYIQFVRFDGTELSDPIRDQKEIDGPITEMLRRMDEIFEANNAIATFIDRGTREVQHPEYPLVALQQIGRNAVLHRNYDGTNAPIRIYWFRAHPKTVRMG